MVNHVNICNNRQSLDAMEASTTEENGNGNIAVHQLANGFLNLYEKDLIRVKGSLQEILYDL